MPIVPFLALFVLAPQAFRPGTLSREVGFVPDGAAAVRGGAAFLDLEVLETLLGARASYSARTGRIVVAVGRRRAVLRVGSPTMLVDGATVRVPTPYARPDGGAMAPFRPVARALGIAFEYESATESLLVPRPGGKARCIPLPSARPGVVIVSVSRGEGTGPEVRVQIQANVPKGRLVVQLRDADGAVFLEAEPPAYGGRYGQVLSFLGKRDETGDRVPASVAAFVRMPDGSTTKAVIAKA